MFPDLAIRVKSYAANMGSGFVVIAGFLLAIAMVFIMVFVLVFARWNGVKNNASYSMTEDKPKLETTINDSGYVTVFIPEAD